MVSQQQKNVNLLVGKSTTLIHRPCLAKSKEQRANKQTSKKAKQELQHPAPRHRAMTSTMDECELAYLYGVTLDYEPAHANARMTF